MSRRRNYGFAVHPNLPISYEERATLSTFQKTPSELSISFETMSPLDRGKHEYREKDYKTALTFFNEAVNTSTGFLLLNALDHRAAAYEKLEQLQPALRDAKRMIELKPDASKGYLRCGKILQLKGEDALALKIYQRGLKKVNMEGDDQRALLQSMFNKVTQLLNPGITYDPVKLLPLELIEIVFQNLPMEDRVVCLRITKVWKRLLESSHKLWTTLDTTTARKAISHQSLKAHYRRSNYTLDHAVITAKAAFDSNKTAYLTRTCKYLKKIEYYGPMLLGDSLTSALPDAKRLENIYVACNVEMTLNTVQATLAACRNTLIHATFLLIRSPQRSTVRPWAQMDNLQTLILRDYGSTIANIVDLQKKTPNLRKLVLAGWKLSNCTNDFTSWTRLEYLDLSFTGLVLVPNLPPTLRYLILKQNPQLHAAFQDKAMDPVLDKNATILPGLVTLNIENTFIYYPSLHILTLQSIVNGTLKTLHIGGRLNNFNNIAPHIEFPASTTVEDLSLASMIIGDDTTMAILDLYPALKKVDLSCTKITGVTVKSCVERGIKDIRIDECTGVGQDAVEWARGKGVNVRFNFPHRG